MNSKMLRVIITALLCLGLGRPGRGLEGGRPAQPHEYQYLASVESDGKRLCLGVILSSKVVATTDECWKTGRHLSSVEVVLYADGKTGLRRNGWFMASNVDVDDVNESELGIAMVYLPSSELDFAPKHPRHPKFPQGFYQAAGVGSDLKIAAVDVVELSQCLGHMNLTNPRTLQSTLLCAVRNNSTKSLGDVPPGQFCTQDIGAPLVLNGEVIGLLIQAECPDGEVHRAVFRKLEFKGKPYPEDASEKLLQANERQEHPPYVSEPSTVDHRHRRNANEGPQNDATAQASLTSQPPIRRSTVESFSPEPQIGRAESPTRGGNIFQPILIFIGVLLSYLDASTEK